MSRQSAIAHRQFTSRLDLYLSVLLILVTALVYWRVTDHQFLNCDDHIYVTDNRIVQHGLTLAGLRWAISSGYASNWHPVTWASHMLDCSLFQLSPGGHHLTNLLLHLANTVLLFQFLRRLTGARWRCALVAALFAWHPLHIESVAWVAERKDVLSTFFLILSLWAYVRYVEAKPPSPVGDEVTSLSSVGMKMRLVTPSATWFRRSSGWYSLALLWFGLGLMSKPMLVTLPCLLLLLDYWPLGRLRFSTAGVKDLAHTDGRSAMRTSKPNPDPVPLISLLVEKIPFFVLSFASCVVTLWAQKRTGALSSLEAVPFSLRVPNAFVSCAAYLRKMIWPADLAVFYPLSAKISPVLLVASILLLAFISLLVWRYRNSRPYLVVGWLWYLGTLMSVIGLVQAGAQSMADRYTYVPLIGVFIMLAWMLGESVPSPARGPDAGQSSNRPGVASDACRQESQIDRYLPAAPTFTIHCPSSIIPLVFSVLILVACLLATDSYLRCWQNSRTLFEHATRVTKDNGFAHHNLAVALKSEGRIAEAMAHYLEAVRINPTGVTAHFNLAMNYVEQDRIADAMFYFSEVVRLNMDDAPKHDMFGVALARQGHLAEAVEQFSAAVRRDPKYARAHYNLAFALSQQGKILEAIASYREALRLQPQWPQALQSLAWLLATHEDNSVRNGVEAVRLAEEACRLTGYQHPAYLDTLAAAYAEANRLTDAVATASKALTLAKNARQAELAAQIQSRIQLYQSAKAYREKPEPKPSPAKA